MATPRSRAGLAGLLAGLRLASKSYEPSLMRRSAIDQGIIVGGSFVAGFVGAAAISRAFDVLPDAATNPVLKAASTLAAGAQTAQMLGSSPSMVGHIDPEHAGWMEAGSEVLAAVALSRLITEDGFWLPRALAVATFTAATVADTREALAARPDPPDTVYVATSIGVGTGASLALGGVAGLISLGAWLPGKLSGAGPIGRAAGGAVGAIAVAAALGYAGRYGASGVIVKISGGNRATEIAYSDAPDLGSVTGGNGSEVPFDTLGLQGRRLVSEVVPVDDIEEIMHEPARATPTRIYIGLDSGETEDDLIDLAIDELARTGSFDRSTIIAASPAGTGYVNYIASEAAELMSRGDCATVAVQYGTLPSMLSMNKVNKAARVYAALLTRIRQEITARGSSSELCAYGESLGATTGQLGVEWASPGRSLIVDRALWVGTPRGSALFERLTAQDGVPVFDDPKALTAYLENNDAPRIIFLNHDNDPVTHFAPQDAYRMPRWLAESDRGRGTDPNQRWLPAVAFFQGLIDTKNAATVVPGEFFSTGHDYRADLGTFIRVAYGFNDVDADQMERIEARLRASEVARAERIDLGKIHTA